MCRVTAAGRQGPTRPFGQSKELAYLFGDYFSVVQAEIFRSGHRSAIHSLHFHAMNDMQPSLFDPLGELS